MRKDHWFLPNEDEQMKNILTLLIVFLIVQGFTSSEAFSLTRDWEKDPASVEIPFAEKVGVVGDVHGAFPEMANTIVALGFCEWTATNTFTLKWTGGKNVLVFIGDYGDRGEFTKEVYDAVMDLEQQAEQAGGRVVALMGNHEIYLIGDLVEKRARHLREYDAPKTAINTILSFEKSGLNYYRDVVSPKSKYGSWIRRRPCFAVINGFMFIHAGPDLRLLSRDELAKEYRHAMENELFNSPNALFRDEFGPFMIRDWWGTSDRNIAQDGDFWQKSLDKFGVKGLVFGHTPGAMGMEGHINTARKRLICVDVGMTPYYRHSKGIGLLMTVEESGKMSFRARFADRSEYFLFDRDFKNPGNGKPSVKMQGTVARVTLPVQAKRGNLILNVTDFKTSSLELHPTPGGEKYVTVFQAENLSPKTKYFYRLKRDGEDVAGMKGTFVTP